MSVQEKFVMKNKADSEDVNRILDALLSQGNGEEISFWVWDHMCGVCEYRKAGVVKED
jgi:hypothetical protein